MEESPAPPTNLLSLPTELLIKIARDVAPHGGRKAGNLRLVCRHLDCVVAPVTWASIVLPTDADGLQEIATELLNDRTENTSYITSVRYNVPETQLRRIVVALKALPALRRLHLVGTSDELFVPRHDLLGSFPEIDNLCLEYVDLDSMWDLKAWAPNVTSLELVNCDKADAPFFNDDDIYCIGISTVTNLRFFVTREKKSTITNYAIRALIACRRAPRSLTLTMDLSDSGENEALMQEDDFNLRTMPFSFTLAGATKLFGHSPPNDPGAPVIVRILNWIAVGPLTTLTLPVFDMFFANDALANLSLPRVQDLVLKVDSTSQSFFTSVSLISNYTHLVRFLKIASLPSLSTLHLQIWFSASEISNLALIATSDLPAKSPLLGLLDFLRTTTVMELRLGSSSADAEGDVQCIFSRGAEGEWSSRLARFW